MCVQVVCRLIRPCYILSRISRSGVSGIQAFTLTTVGSRSISSPLDNRIYVKAMHAMVNYSSKYKIS